MTTITEPTMFDPTGNECGTAIMLSLPWDDYSATEDSAVPDDDVDDAEWVAVARRALGQWCKDHPWVY